MRIATILCFVLIQNLIFVASVFGQKSELKKADILFNAGKYESALAAYNNYGSIDKKPDLLIKRGICYLKTNQPDPCIKDMIQADKLKSRDNQRFSLIAEALMSKGDYVQAARFFKAYLARIPRNSPAWNHTINQIKKCGFAKNGKYFPQIAFVENLGSRINTKYDEFSPLQSPNNLFRYYFSAAKPGSIGGLLNDEGFVDPVRGKYTADIYYTELVDGNWTSIQSLGENINSPANEIIQGFSDGGKIMYYLRKPIVGPSKLVSDTFSIEKIKAIDSLASIINMPFRPELGDKDLHFFNDSIMLFSAKRNHGFGGYDLYYATRSKGVWSLAVNMGAEVNSSFDEITPYLTKDGSILYFSSDRNESFGGFDVFSTTFENYQWQKPQNLGLPINAPGDDFGFQVATDGTMALMASNRLSSFGGFDLYVCYFKDQILDQFNIADIPEFIYAAALPSDELAALLEASKKQTTQPMVRREIVLRSILFNEDHDLLNPSNVTYLKNLANTIDIYPKTKVIIQSHTTVTGKPESELFFSLKRAETIAEQLVKLGVNRDNIIIQGYGANFPMVQNYDNNQPNRLAQSINKRIDLRLIPEENTPLMIQYNWPVVPDAQIDAQWTTFQNNFKDRPLFKIKFAETVQMLKNELTSSDNRVFIEKYSDNNNNIYTTGQYATWDEAYKAKNKLISHDIFNTTIIPYMNGIKMTPAEINAYKSKFPELEKYLQENK